ncbi:glycoside hydrolase family 2 TIM barrel-domain containing protein [Saccharibacillus sp. CPCC 101409]|uniref:glycoside hydrolase family 2 TIM barrel-domain containing protein n=1 Tax=Saccharibacillus sp. CPCC 101409 TaxID=3058041 RepID=UPI002671AEAF|nr:glycoside hydrolase family 2 TIM barrel-domain containing protein [Saccharibacillus sp. CPCC 101409]MDO3412561.1 glycoside hydrolase family 2 TIM barrel-domain containing protein [Saccharibacillus sp. CPCC 101409]
MRSRICLNGEWDFMPLYDRPQELSLPENPRYEERKVLVPSSWRGSYEPEPGRIFGKIPEYGFELFAPFGYPPEWDRAEAGVLRRSFAVPEEYAGGRIVLRLDGVMQQAAVYLDGERLAVWRDGYLPLRLDITDRTRPGETHELQVVCANFDKTELPSGALKVTGLTGSWFGYLARGLWQDVWLESLPPLTIERTSIRTSVRRGTLEVQALVGAGGRFAPSGELAVRLTVRRAEKADRDGRASRPVVLAASAKLDGGETYAGGGTSGGGMSVEDRLCENTRLPALGRARFELDWRDAELWSPDSPSLYAAELELLENGAVVDRIEEIFGFREFRSEGPLFMLNEIPLRLRGDSWHFQGPTQQTEEYVRTWYRMCREVGVNCIRLHAEPYPEYFLRIADEEGMLIVGETAIYGSGKSMAADHPDYILNALDHVRRLVLRDRNHPSVVMWSVENEMRWVDGRDEFKRHIPALTDAMRLLDPTRPICAEGDNRLLPKERTEVESRHYNIDGTIGQWDRSVPLTFGEHGSWWYICPQNASVYAGLKAYRHTDESVAGLAEKERLFAEYARRQEVSGISTFNFAHYFMRAMPERDIPLEWPDPEAPGVKPAYIPAYSLTLNNGLLPPEYPAYRPNPAFKVMKEAFRPAALIASEYDRCFFDDAAIGRGFDVYNDTLAAREVRVEFRVSQGGRELRRQTLQFRQQPAERRRVEFVWTPDRIGRPAGAGWAGWAGTAAAPASGSGEESRPESGEAAGKEQVSESGVRSGGASVRGVKRSGIQAEAAASRVDIPPASSSGFADEETAELTAVLLHGGEVVHEVKKTYRVFSASLRRRPVEARGACFYIGGDRDYGIIGGLLPDCRRVEAGGLERLPAGSLLIVGSRIQAEGGGIERAAREFAARGGRLLVLEQESFAIGRLTLSRRDFIRAHAGSYAHPVLAGFGDDDLMFWDAELREDGPAPICAAAFEKPRTGDFRLLLECSAGDFGDGGDLWTPLLEYRGGRGYLLANQLDLMSRFERVPQACLLLRRLLEHAAGAGEAAGEEAASAPGSGRAVDRFADEAQRPEDSRASSAEAANEAAIASESGGADSNTAGFGGASSAAARAGRAASHAAPAYALTAPGSAAERLLSALRLPHTPLRGAADLQALLRAQAAGEQPVPAAAPGAEQPELSASDAEAPGTAGGADTAAPSGAALPSMAAAPGLLVLDPARLREPGAAEAARAFAEAGGAVLVLPCGEAHAGALARLLDRPVRVAAHEAYQLEADDARPLACGLSPADLFGLDKVHHSPRDVENLPLGLHRIEADGVRPVCVSVEGTAWKDYFVHKYTAEHSRLALVELNRDRAREPGAFLIEAAAGAGRVVCSQIAVRPELDKCLRIYSRLLANLGASFEDDLWSDVKSDAQYAIEAMMALPCRPYQDEQAMRAYYTDPEFSLNNLGEGLYGWMKKKERSFEDGAMSIRDSAGGLWFMSAFVHVPEFSAAAGPHEASPLADALPGRVGANGELRPASVSAPGEAAAPAGQTPVRPNTAQLIRPARLRLLGNIADPEIWLNGERPEHGAALKPGVNRLIAVLRGGAEDIRFGLVFLHPDGTYMDDLRYRMTIDEVEPK